MNKKLIKYAPINKKTKAKMNNRDENVNKYTNKKSIN